MEQLGAGGMGIVYRAHDTKLDRDVALKFLPPELTRDLESTNRFINEARAASALDHPNICTIYEIGQTDQGQSFISMAYYDGQTLRERIKYEGLKIDEAVNITLQIARGLQKAHEKGIIHRDIKPANIIVTSDGTAKILDFGLAKLANKTMMTKTGTTMGTISYMSPEQTRGEPVDQRSDIWSFGVLLYEMLTGEQPFKGDYEQAIIYSILNTDPDPPSELNPDISPELEAIVLKTLSREPSERYTKMAELIDDLRRATGEDVPVRRKRTLAKTAWWLLLIPLVLILVLFGRQLIEQVENWFNGPKIQSLAVLPLKNLTGDPGQDYFCDGMTDALISELARIGSFRVISWQSTMQYKNTDKTMAQIARELNVDRIIVCSFLRSDDRTQVNANLIEPYEDRHLWSQRYHFQIADIFQFYNDFTKALVSEIEVQLTPAQAEHLTKVPTINPEAYLLYLQGNEYLRSRPGYLRQNIEIAQQLYKRAITLDPEFALAHAALSEVHGLMHWFGYDMSPERVALQRETAETALRLAPDLPQAHLAMGMMHYLGRRDYRRALNAFSVALEWLPNDGQVVAMIGYTNRRLGNWDEVFAAFEKATELDPRNANLFGDLGGYSLWTVRRYADAVQAFERALELAPDLHDAAVRRGWTFVGWQGQLDSLRQALERVPVDHYLYERAELLHYQRDADAMLELLTAVPVTSLPKSIWVARAYQLKGDKQMTREAFGETLSILDSVMVLLPDDYSLHAARGLALAGLERNDEALREVRWIEQSFVYREDVYERRFYLALVCAKILAQAGYADSALDEIERLLAGPSILTVHTLRLSPLWDPIREHPRFKSLLAKYSSN